MADLYQDPQATTRRKPVPKPSELAGGFAPVEGGDLAGVTPVSSGGSNAGGSGDLAGYGGVSSPPPVPPPAAPAGAPAAPPPSATLADPFAAIGGGVQLAGGEWVPKGHPLAAQAAPAPAAAPAPEATTLRRQPGAPAPAQPTVNPADPFASMGGGTQLPTGEWVPPGHPLAQAAWASPPATAAAAVSADPFTSVGGGVQLPTGEWIPKGTAADPWKGVGADVVAANPAGTSLVGQPPAAPPVAPPPAVAPPVAPAAPVAPIGDNLSGDVLSLLDQPKGPAPTTVAPAPAQTAAAPTAAEQLPNAYRESLLKMLDAAQTPASLEDPALKARSDANRLAQTRATERGRAALAERAAAKGGIGTDSGAFDRELAGLFTGQGEREGAFDAELLGEAQDQKIQQLQSALTMMGGDVNSAEGRALTRELANAQLAQGAKQFEAEFGLAGKKLGETIRQFDVTTEAGKAQLAQQLQIFREQMAQQGKQFDVDAALKRLGIESQTNLGAGDLALRDKLGTGGLNAQIAQMLMQNQQFGQRLGADVGMFNQSQNNSFLDSLLRQFGA